MTWSLCLLWIDILTYYRRVLQLAVLVIRERERERERLLIYSH